MGPQMRARAVIRIPRNWKSIKQSIVQYRDQTEQPLLTAEIDWLNLANRINIRKTVMEAERSSRSVSIREMAKRPRGVSMRTLTGARVTRIAEFVSSYSSSAIL